ncbi:MAG TPA: LLM class F420-dependent oxidoreductase [Solirubrobacteraceae bacterium]|jgi:probable F420-dependent oxidoreductase|nr:LLM class F420-dependent oxidoreductase [Solirubrobacteraceae bacterium]
MAELAGVGLWAPGFREGEPGEVREAVAELEGLGYTALWMPGGAGGPILERAQLLVDASTRITVATGILNIWAHPPEEAATAHASIELRAQGRFLLGLGVSHAPMVDRIAPGGYGKPLSKMRSYLDALDAQPTPVPPSERVLAALGPKMLDLARERAAGAHPYFVPVAHTRFARQRLGPGPLLAPEQGVVLDENPTTAKEKAREHVSRYLQLPNYTNNLLRHGLTEDDLRDGGSDRLLDAIVVMGGVEAVARRIAAHREVGADHVCLQVLGEGLLPLAQWRALAEGLSLTD